MVAGAPPSTRGHPPLTRGLYVPRDPVHPDAAVYPRWHRDSVCLSEADQSRMAGLAVMLSSAAQTSMISMIFLVFPDDERRGLQVDFDWYTTYGIPF